MKCRVYTKGDRDNSPIFVMRQRLVDARDQHDQQVLVELLGTLDLIRDSAWESNAERLAALVQDMIDATQDALMGVSWKSDLPSTEAIRSL